MGTSFTASEVIVATSKHIEGPYTITTKGHFRPGAGHDEPDAMGDRVGGLKLDFSTDALDSADTSHPYYAVQPGYPAMATQYGAPATTSPYSAAYTAAAEYGLLGFNDVYWNTTVKAVAVVMTPWNAALYNKYKDTYNVSPSTYIVRYPTETRSGVTEAVFDIGDTDSQLTSVTKPSIGPTLAESKSKCVVCVNSGDAAFITTATANGAIYYTTDGKAPDYTNATQVYAPGSRITVSGAAGTRLTVRAVTVLGSKVSKVATQTYEIASRTQDVPGLQANHQLPFRHIHRGLCSFTERSQSLLPVIPD